MCFVASVVIRDINENLKNSIESKIARVLTKFLHNCIKRAPDGISIVIIHNKTTIMKKLSKIFQGIDKKNNFRINKLELIQNESNDRKTNPLIILIHGRLKIIGDQIQPFIIKIKNEKIISLANGEFFDYHKTTDLNNESNTTKNELKNFMTSIKFQNKTFKGIDEFTHYIINHKLDNAIIVKEYLKNIYNIYSKNSIVKGKHTQNHRNDNDIEHMKRFKEEKSRNKINKAIRKTILALNLKYDGEFAGIIYDSLLNSLICFRDVFGKRPLFFYNSKDILVINSSYNTIKTFLEEIKNNFNKKVYLNNIQELKPKEILIFHVNKCEDTSKNNLINNSKSKVKKVSDTVTKINKTNATINSIKIINKYSELKDLKLSQKKQSKVLIQQDRDKDRDIINNDYNQNNKKNNKEAKLSKALVLKQLLEESVWNRIKDQRKIGILFSGGIDSTIISHIAIHTTINHNIPKEFLLLTIGKENSKDVNRAKKFFSMLKDTIQEYEHKNNIKLNHKIITLNNTNIREYINKAMRIIEYYLELYDKTSKNEQKISNRELIMQISIATFMLIAASEFKKQDIKVVLSGNSADEIFLGYKRHETMLRKINDSSFKYKLEQILENELNTHYFKNIDRDELCFGEYGIELRLPFLNTKMVNFSSTLNKEDFMDGKFRKLILVKLLSSLFNKSIIDLDQEIPLKKIALQFGSGIEKMIEKRLKKRLKTHKSKRNGAGGGI